MSLEIDPREVLEHLEYLGYTSITKDQLIDFIKDLKKLIKYEQTKEKKVQEVPGKLSVACETSLPFEAMCTNCWPETVSHSIDFVGNYANHQCLVNPGTMNLDRSYHSEDFQNSPPDQDDLCCKKLGKKNYFRTFETKDGFETEKQPYPSFIRPGMCKPTKCDPVALYHFYQTEWSKKPLPGEDPRTDLRWAVRTRLAQKQHQQKGFLRKTTSIDRLHRKKVPS